MQGLEGGQARAGVFRNEVRQQDAVDIFAQKAGHIDLVNSNLLCVVILDNDWTVPKPVQSLSVISSGSTPVVLLWEKQLCGPTYACVQLQYTIHFALKPPAEKGFDVVLASDFLTWLEVKARDLCRATGHGECYPEVRKVQYLGSGGATGPTAIS